MRNYEHDGVDESYNVCLQSCQKCSVLVGVAPSIEFLAV